MKEGDLFEIARDSLGELHRFGPWHYMKFRGRYTGEKRKPKRGEWFLSGSKIESYYAFADSTCEYHMAELVLINERVVVDVVKVLTANY